MPEDKQQKMNATPARIRKLLQSANQGSEAYLFAMRSMGAFPDNSIWLKQLHTLLRHLGGVLLLIGVVGFFVSIWPAMHSYVKFFLLELSLVVTLWIAWKFEFTSQIGKYALTASSLLLGVLLIAFSQAYPTVSGSHELYLTWALLILPWTIMSRFVLLWFGWLLLLQVSLVMMWWQDKDWIQLLTPGIALTMAALNLIFLFVWKLAYKEKSEWLHQHWPARIALITAVSILTAPIINFYFIKSMPFDPVKLNGMMLLLLCTYLVTVASSAWYYSRIRSDLFNLCVVSLSLVAVVTSFCFRLLSQYVHQPKLFILLLGLILLGQISMATGWLMRTAKRVAP